MNMTQSWLGSYKNNFDAPRIKFCIVSFKNFDCLTIPFCNICAHTCSHPKKFKKCLFEKSWLIFQRTTSLSKLENIKNKCLLGFANVFYIFVKNHFMYSFWVRWMRILMCQGKDIQLVSPWTWFKTIHQISLAM